MTGERFNSKIDWWLAVLVALPFLRLLWILGNGIADGRTPRVGGWIALAGMGFVAWLFTSTYYVVTDDEVRVVAGPFCSRRPVKSITMIRPMRSTLSAPALSLDRIEVVTDKGAWMIISPKDKQGFADAIVRRGVNVRVEGLS